MALFCWTCVMVLSTGIESCAKTVKLVVAKRSLFTDRVSDGERMKATDGWIVTDTCCKDSNDFCCSSLVDNRPQGCTATTATTYVGTTDRFIRLKGSSKRSQAVTGISRPYYLTAHLRSCDDIGHVTIWYPIGHFLLVILWNWVSISSHFHLRSKRIGVTSLTFQGHVTSSVTWPFDTPYAIFYWWSFGTKILSLTASKIFNVECNAMVDMILIRLLNKGQGHSFWYQSISHIRLPIDRQ